MRKTLEIFLDIFARFGARDAELVGKAESGNTVDDAEVDGLGTSAHFRRHAFHRHPEHFRCGHRMNVDAVFECAAKLRNVGDMGKHT